MPFLANCPTCGKKLKVPDELLGKTVRCADCAGTFTAEKPSAASAPPSAPAPRPRDDDFERDDDRDDRPSRRRSRDRDRGNLAPHRGGMIMTLGIIGLVILVIEMIGYVFVGPFGLPISIVGLVFGIIAWIMGSNDLKQIKAGTMDPDGQGMTMGGYI